MDTELRDEETYALIGAAMEVHRVLSCGFLEAVYQAAYAHELTLRNLPFEREKQFNILYKERPLDAYYRADFFCFGSVVVELKALAVMSGTEEAQIINSLKASGQRRGLLINFGQPKLGLKRFVN